MKKIAFVLLLLSSCSVPAAVTPPPYIPVQPGQEKTYFVQVWTDKAGPDMMLLEGEDPGRVEVYEGNDVNNTVACAQFRTTKDWQGDQLANISIGFVYRGNDKNLRFKLFGAAGRLTQYHTKITEKPEPAAGD